MNKIRRKKNKIFRLRKLLLITLAIFVISNIIMQPIGMLYRQKITDVEPSVFINEVFKGVNISAKEVETITEVKDDTSIETHTETYMVDDVEYEEIIYSFIDVFYYLYYLWL